MARKSRRNNNIIEKKQEMMTPEIITGPQLETGVYARLSVEKDNEETIQTQIEMLHQYVEEHGEYHLVDTYVDNGYTGTDFDRPGFIRMMEDVRKDSVYYRKGFVPLWKKLYRNRLLYRNNFSMFECQAHFY